MTQTPEVSVEPTQADREAARKLYGSSDWSQERIATHFARHRLASQPSGPATQPSATVGEVKYPRPGMYDPITGGYFGAPILEGPFLKMGWTMVGVVFQGTGMRWMTDEEYAATLHTPPPVATATVVDAVRKAVRDAWFDGRGSRGDQYDSEAVEQVWDKLVARVLAATPTPTAGER